MDVRCGDQEDLGAMRIQAVAHVVKSEIYSEGANTAARASSYIRKRFLPDPARSGNARRSKSRENTASSNNPSDMSTLMVDGHAELCIATTRTPASYILDMESSMPGLRWLSIDKPNAEKRVH